jgi:hypothetical protein
MLAYKRRSSEDILAPCPEVGYDGASHFHVASVQKPKSLEYSNDGWLPHPGRSQEKHVFTASKWLLCGVADK